MIVTPERQRAIIEQNRKIEAEEAAARERQRLKQARQHAAEIADLQRQEAARAERRILREARAAKREAKNAARDRLLRLEGTFTIGQAQAKLLLVRGLLLPAIRRALKAGHIRKVSRRRYRCA